ncbi:MAG: hypothetical protein ACREQ9_02190 [Candidatus Binatia bacterium]
MREFAEAFLLVFAQLGVGGLLSLSIPPFRQIERGFFKSTAAVYLGVSLLSVIGWGYLLLTRNIPAAEVPHRSIELAVWTSFAAVFAVYLYSLWGEPYRLRARSYAAGLALGVGALSFTALRYGRAASLAGIVYPVDFLVSAVLLGAACTGMLLGHWYLIDLGLTLTPFRQIHRFFVGSIHLQVLVLGVSVCLLWLFAGPPVGASLETLWTEHTLLLTLRIALGPLAAYVLGWMIGRTLAVPQTMAATGLFYIALLAVVVGEILGRTILFRTALPL